MKKEFITYGIIIDPEKFERIKNGRKMYMNKPDGGLWTSPTDSEWGWKDWCESENFNVSRLSSYTKFNLKDTAKILVIDSLEEFYNICDKYTLKIHGSLELAMLMMGKLLDFEAIEKDGYYGILLTDRGNIQCHLPLNLARPGYSDLNAWDVETLLLFNLDHIERKEIWRSSLTDLKRSVINIRLKRRT